VGFIRNTNLTNEILVWRFASYYWEMCLIGSYTSIAHLSEHRMTQRYEEQALKLKYSFGKVEN